MVVVNHVVTEGSFRFLGSLKDSCRENDCFLYVFVENVDEISTSSGFYMNLEVVVVSRWESGSYISFLKCSNFGSTFGATKISHVWKTRKGNKTPRKNITGPECRSDESFPKHSRYRKHICLHLPLKNQPNAAHTLSVWDIDFGVWGEKLSLNSESFFHSDSDSWTICWRFDSQKKNLPGLTSHTKNMCFFCFGGSVSSGDQKQVLPRRFASLGWFLFL